MHLFDELTYCTARIETTYPNGEKGTGTGFFFTLFEDKGITVPLLITNKHVISGTSECIFHLSGKKADGSPNDKLLIQVPGPGELGGWKFHPDTDIDLCCLPLAAIVELCHKKGIEFFLRPLGRETMPRDEDYSNFSAMEDIIMVGYPNGLWDEKHNKPIIRKGITATHLCRNYMGRPEFMIDCACFPGSSGSPVFLLRKNLRIIGGKMDVQETACFIGILYAGPQHYTEAEIKFTKAPIPKAVGLIPSHLGFALKASLIWDFLKLYEVHKSGKDISMEPAVMKKGEDAGGPTVNPN